MGIENLKIIRKNDICNLVYEFPEHHKPNDSQLFRLNNSFTDKFFPVSVTNDIFSVKLTVSLTGYCSLKQYLPMLPVKRNHFLHIVSDILNCMDEAEIHGFGRKQILMDPDYVMICPSDLSVKLICIPDISFSQYYPLNVLLRNIAERTVFTSDTDISFLDAYIDITYMNEKTCAGEMKKFINTIISFSETDKEKSLNRCPGCGALVILGDTCCICGYNAEKQEHILPGTSAENVILQHCTDGTLIKVDRFPFRIGRAAENTEYYTENMVVSRVHAELNHENSDYYIVDKNSTNGTFINNRKIKSSERTILKDSDIFTLGDESFIFFVKQTETGGLL